ncbi:transcriptional regulator [Brumimicrobium glaciale]|uniref:Transcriptional regulator n=1 Tax=Brumimicrobium glaciale TaxID=200475 RepID=A0A4Q4KSG1_9FLAO|nr:helix-turn-helix domain-containing protein [Brumimicrobium glaciale]RYM35609.1 transcriptional regulator [Brumimicrobium glaciale]
MEILKYTIIKDKKQYFDYCNILENLIVVENNTSQDEIELLELLIEKWDEERNSFDDLDPIELLKSLMNDNNLKAQDLVNILDLTKGTISKLLNYHKGLSKEVIRKLATHFKVNQEAFNRPYELKNDINRDFKNARLMNIRKKMLNT